jgi:hypothetical protein
MSPAWFFLFPCGFELFGRVTNARRHRWLFEENKKQRSREFKVLFAAWVLVTDVVIVVSW